MAAAAASARHWTDADTLSVVLSFMTSRELTGPSLRRVCRAFRDCIARSPHAWPPVFNTSCLLGASPALFPRLLPPMLPFVTRLELGSAVAASPALVVPRFAGVRELDVGRSPCTDVELDAIMRGCPLIERVNLCLSETITERGLRSILEHGFNLKTIITDGSTTEGLADGPPLPSSISVLSMCVTEADADDDSDATALLAACPSLRWLDECLTSEESTWSPVLVRRPHLCPNLTAVSVFGSSAAAQILRARPGISCISVQLAISDPEGDLGEELHGQSYPSVRVLSMRGFAFAQTRKLLKVFPRVETIIHLTAGQIDAEALDEEGQIELHCDAQGLAASAKRRRRGRVVRVFRAASVASAEARWALEVSAVLDVSLSHEVNE